MRNGRNQNINILNLEKLLLYFVYIQARIGLQNRIYVVHVALIQNLRSALLSTIWIGDLTKCSIQMKDLIDWFWSNLPKRLSAQQPSDGQIAKIQYALWAAGPGGVPYSERDKSQKKIIIKMFGNYKQDSARGDSGFLCKAL